MWPLRAAQCNRHWPARFWQDDSHQFAPDERQGQVDRQVCSPCKSKLSNTTLEPNTDMAVRINFHQCSSTKTQIIILKNAQSTSTLLDQPHFLQNLRHYDPHWKRPQHVSCGRVTFWDTRGFEKIADKEKAALILRYILEGRLNFRLFTQGKRSRLPNFYPVL